MTTKKKIGISALAVLLAGLVTGSAIGTAKYIDNDTDIYGYETTAAETSAENLAVNIGNSNGIKLTASTLTASSTTPTYVTGDYTLTVTYNSDATSPSFTWTSSDTTSITLTPSSDTKSCTVKCNSAFSKQIIITCTADDNADAYATCTVDYYKRATDAALSVTHSAGDDLAWSSSSEKPTLTLGEYSSSKYAPADKSVSSYIEYSSFTPTLGTGTLTETYTLSSITLNDYANTRSRDFTSYCYYYYLLYTACGSYPTTSTTTNKLIYTILNSNYTNGSSNVYIKLTFTGDVTGIEYTYDYYMLINPSNFYTAVSTASLNNSSLAY